MLSLFPDQVNVMRKYSKHIIIVVGLMAISMISLAQPTRRPPGPPRPRIPIDGGISILAAAGVAYGARKLYLFKKQEEADKLD